MDNLENEYTINSLLKALELYKQGKTELKEILYAKGIIGELESKLMDGIKIRFADVVEDILNAHDTATGKVKE